LIHAEKCDQKVNYSYNEENTLKFAKGCAENNCRRDFEINTIRVKYRLKDMEEIDSQMEKFIFKKSSRGKDSIYERNGFLKDWKKRRNGFLKDWKKRRNGLIKVDDTVHKRKLLFNAIQLDPKLGKGNEMFIGSEVDPME
jgi:hypothetical protein